MQIGLAKAPDLPDVPLLMDLGTNDEDRALLRVLSASTHIGRPIFTTPGAPPERVEALRKAFDTMVHDPAFLAEARREKFDIEPTTGEAMQKHRHRDDGDAEGAERAAEEDHRVADGLHLRGARMAVSKAWHGHPRHASRGQP